MNLETKIKELEIKKILIADDTAENIEAARQYFLTLAALGVKTEYANSAKQAKQMVQQAYQGKDKYSLVISDLVMEEEKSGFEVVKEAFKHLSFGFIATGFDHHGPITSVKPVKESISGKKDRPEVWKQIFDKVTDYLIGDGKAIFASMKRFDKYVSAPSDSVAETCMVVYRN